MTEVRPRPSRKLASRLLRAAPVRGFTLLELLVVVGLLAMGACLQAPALARTRPDVQATQCLGNLRRLQTGCQMFANDSADLMMPNAPLGLSSSQTWCGSSQESWFSASANTNPAIYKAALLAPYVQNHLELYKCPGDKLPSSNGPRIRSYSMNGQMGMPYSTGINPGYKTYVKVTDLGGSLPPAMAVVLCDENMCSLNDGYLQVSCNTPLWPDVPGSYHNGGLGASFADGHAELHQWTTTSLWIPVRFGFTLSNVGASGSNADYLWWKSHVAAPLGQ